MRRSEITDELIRLSKLAKELGFPQDMDKGDWYLGGDKKTLELIETTGYFLIGSTLILSFSRCLEWLREQGCYTWLVGFTEKDTKPLFVHVYRGNEIIEGEGKSIEECGAKAVVKILEGKE